MVRGLVVSGAILMAGAAMTPAAHAADAGRGEQLAKSHCASCHSVTAQPPREVADAPPFPVIGRKYAFDQIAIAAAIAGPHPKMNFSPNPADAADIAAYVASLRN